MLYGICIPASKGSCFPRNFKWQASVGNSTPNSSDENKDGKGRLRHCGDLIAGFSESGKHESTRGHPTLSCVGRRFLWVVQYLVGAGFYVIPAYSPADNSVDNTVVSAPLIFQRNWANLWAAVTDLPSYNSTLRARVLLDLLNEPDQFGLHWESPSERKGFRYPSLLELYGNTMNASALLCSLCCILHAILRSR